MEQQSRGDSTDRPSKVGALEGVSTDPDSALAARFGDSARWRAILDVAAGMFATQGYDATSIQHIADRVGITKGSMYHYIDSKDDLLFHVLIEIHDVHLRHFDVYASAPGGPLERLRAFIEGHVRVNIDEIDRGSIFYLNFDSLSAHRRELILERRRNFDAFVRQVLRDGKREGLVRPELNEEIAALGILTALNSMYLWWDPSRSADIDVPKQFADLFIAGVTGTPAQRD
jgi:AcrR family transcriptional regulator